MKTEGGMGKVERRRSSRLKAESRRAAVFPEDSKLKERRMREDGRGAKEAGKMDEKRTNKIRTVRDLKVYRKAFDSACRFFHCKYIDEETFHRLDDSYKHIFAMLYAMEKKADTFCLPSS